MPITGPDGQRESVHERAESRRTALKALLEKEGITVAELARRAGLQRPNSLYNFFTGRTASLSSVTLTKIKEACPSADVLSLMGAPAPLQVAPRYVPASVVDPIPDRVGVQYSEASHPELVSTHTRERIRSLEAENIELKVLLAEAMVTVRRLRGSPDGPAS